MNRFALTLSPSISPVRQTRPRRRFAFGIALAGGLALSAPNSAQAATQDITIDHNDRQSLFAPGAVRYVGNQFKVPGNSYYVAAINSGGFSRPANRPYFIFDLSSSSAISGRIVGAKIRFFHPSDSYDGNPDPSETMTLHAVDNHSADDLRNLKTPTDPNTGAPRVATPAELGVLGAMFADLGDGAEYGDLVSSSANQGSYQELDLNAAALADLNTARDAGKEWAVGGNLSTLNLSTTNPHPVRTEEFIFKNSQDTAQGPQPVTQLVLTISDDATPAPVLGGLFGSSLLGLGLAGLATRRRFRA